MLRYPRMVAGWLGVLLVVASCAGDSVTSEPSGPTVSSIAGGSCEDAQSEIQTGFNDLFDQIEEQPAQTDEVLSSVEMDNLFMSLGPPLGSVCGSAAGSVYSEVVEFLARERTSRSADLASEIDRLIAALCEAGVHELSTEALDACAA